MDEKRENVELVETSTKKAKKKSHGCVMFFLLIILVLAVLFSFYKILVKEQGKEEMKIDTKATLEKVVKSDELSTISVIYNGVVEVKNKEKPKKTDYFVSYDSIVTAGIHFEKIEIKEDKENRKYIVVIPEVAFFEPTVDFNSLDFIFVNSKCNNLETIKEAYTVCINDVKAETKKNTFILEKAEEGAVNAVYAITKPLVSQIESEGYTLEIKIDEMEEQK